MNDVCIAVTAFGKVKRLWVQGLDKASQVSQVCSQLRSTIVFPKGWPVSSSLATGDKGEKHGGHHGGKLNKHSRANRGQKDCGIAVLH